MPQSYRGSKSSFNQRRLSYFFDLNLWKQPHSDSQCMPESSASGRSSSNNAAQCWVHTVLAHSWLIWPPITVIWPKKGLSLLTAAAGNPAFIFHSHGVAKCCQRWTSAAWKCDKWGWRDGSGGHWRRLPVHGPLKAAQELVATFWTS